MAERSEVLRVQNDALLGEYHQLIAAQIRRIDESIAVLDRERQNLVVERDHLLKYLPQTDEPLVEKQVRLPHTLPTGHEKSPQEMSAAQDARPCDA